MKPLKHFLSAAAVACAATFAGAPETARAGAYDGKMIFHRGGLCVHPDGRRNDTKDNTRLILHSDACKGSDVRLGFRLENHSGGYKVIRHPYSGKCVHPRGGDNPKDGTELVLYGGDCGLWKTKFKVLSNGAIQHAQSKKCFDVKGGWFRPGKHSRVRLYGRSCGSGRLFRIEDHRKAKEYDVDARIYHSYSGLCVHPKGRRNDTGNDTPLVLHRDVCNGLESRLAFVMQKNGSILHPFSGKCFHPKGGKVNAGNRTPVVLYDGCNHDKNKFRRLSNGAIQHVGSGRCIHPKGGRAKDGVLLWLYNGCRGNDQLKFTIDSHALPRSANSGAGNAAWGKLVLFQYGDNSGKCIQPKGGTRNPGDGHPLVLHKNDCKGGAEHLQFQILRSGAVRHRSGKCISPGLLFKPKETPLKLSNDCRAGHVKFGIGRGGMLVHKLTGMCVLPARDGGFAALDRANLVLWPNSSAVDAHFCGADAYLIRHDIRQ